MGCESHFGEATTSRLSETIHGVTFLSLPQTALCIFNLFIILYTSGETKRMNKPRMPDLNANSNAGTLGILQGSVPPLVRPAEKGERPRGPAGRPRAAHALRSSACVCMYIQVGVPAGEVTSRREVETTAHHISNLMKNNFHSF